MSRRQGLRSSRRFISELSSDEMETKSPVVKRQRKDPSDDSVDPLRGLSDELRSIKGKLKEFDGTQTEVNSLKSDKGERKEIDGLRAEVESLKSTIKAVQVEVSTLKKATEETASLLKENVLEASEDASTTTSTSSNEDRPITVHPNADLTLPAIAKPQESQHKRSSAPASTSQEGSDKMVMPPSIRALPDIYQDLDLNNLVQENLRFVFLRKTLGSELEELEGICCQRKPRRFGSFPGSVWGLIQNPEIQLHAPPEPGRHGVYYSIDTQLRLAADNSVECFHLFVLQRNGGYHYYGKYKKPRESKLLSVEEMKYEVPQSVKAFWAREVVSRSNIRGQYKTNLVSILKERWQISRPTRVLEVSEVSRKKSIGTVYDLEVSDIMEAFITPKSFNKPWLRLRAEYLQCVGFDHAFYAGLIKQKGEMGF
ncbi:MAG: hypothetical protein M1837_005252 [Sclerophora amabilis]|nr:MAG: hypothetical protein M1837_005252 [Sclerophora amabilis]